MPPPPSYFRHADADLPLPARYYAMLLRHNMRAYAAYAAAAAAATRFFAAAYAMLMLRYFFTLLILPCHVYDATPAIISIIAALRFCYATCHADAACRQLPCHAMPCHAFTIFIAAMPCCHDIAAAARYTLPCRCLQRLRFSRC